MNSFIYIIPLVAFSIAFLSYYLIKDFPVAVLPNNETPSFYVNTLYNYKTYFPVRSSILLSNTSTKHSSDLPTQPNFPPYSKVNLPNTSSIIDLNSIKLYPYILEYVESASDLITIFDSDSKSSLPKFNYFNC